MNTLLLLAALSSQITFNTTQQGDVYTIIPEVTLTQSCLCRVCCGQLKLATALEFFQYRFSDSFGGNPPLYSCGLSAL